MVENNIKAGTETALPQREVIKPPELVNGATIEDVFAATGKFGKYVAVKLTGNRIIFFNDNTLGYKLFINEEASNVVGKLLVVEKKIAKAGHGYFLPKLL